MRRVARSEHGLVLFASIAACLLGACSNALDVDYRGRRQIATGDFRIALPLLFGSERYVLAAERDQSTLQLIHFDGSQSCDLGTATRAAAYWTGDGLRIGMYTTEEDGTDTVRFLDDTCEAHLDEFGGIIDASFTSGNVLVETADARLVALDPWGDDVRVISRALTRRGPYARDALGNVTGVWLLEGDRLLQRNFTGERFGDAFDGVITIAAVGDAADEFLVVDADGTSVFSVDGATQERVSDPGCSPRLERRVLWLPEQGERRVSLLSSCENRRLIAVDMTDRGELRVTRYADRVASWWHRTVVEPTDSGLGLPDTWTFYRTQPDSDAAPERVWLARPSDDEAAEFGVDITASSPIWPWFGAPGSREAWASGHGVWLLVTRDGVLGSWSDEHGFVSIAERVERLGLAPLEQDGRPAWILLHDAVEGVATLSRLTPALPFEGNGVLTSIAEGVPADGLIDLTGGGEGSGVIKLTPPRYDGVLRNFDGARGELALLGSEFVSVAQGVPPGAIREFGIALRGSDISQEAETTGAIAYLHDFDATAGVGALAIRLADGRAFEIDRDVSSHRPSNDSFEPGIVYAIGKGPRRGLWFARQ